MAKRGLLGNVELLGLNAFGGDISPLWGTIIGGSIAGATSMTLGHIQGGKMASNRDRWGLLAGLGAAGIMFAMPSTKKAAFGAAVGAFLATGLSWLERALLGTVKAPAVVVETGVKGLGIPRVNYLNGLGIPRVSYLNGLGIPSIAAQPQSVGTIPGVHGLGMRRQADGTYLNGPSFAGTQLGQQAPVNLLGNPSTRSNQISMMGGPQIHGLSAAYGATLLGSGR